MSFLIPKSMLMAAFGVLVGMPIGFLYPLYMLYWHFLRSFNPLAAELFSLLPCVGHGVNFYKPSLWYGLSFSMFTVWHAHFSLVLMISGLRNEAPPPSIVKVSVYTLFLQQRTNRFHFSSYVLNLVKINISFFFRRLVVPG